MSLKCPYCGNDLPDAAHFCLHCCKSLNVENEVIKEDNKKENKNKKKAVPILLKPSIKAKKAIAVTAMSLLTVFICIFVASKVRIPSPSAEPITQIQAVTNPGGETVTDENGENVYEVIEITTEKKGLLEQLFSTSDKNSEKNTDKSNGKDKENNSETTTKQSFLDKLFGKDKDKENPTEKDESTATTADSSTPAESDTSSTAASVSPSSEPSTSSTTSTTTATTTTTKPAETGSSDGIQWTEENGKIKITGYTGNASTVVVPAYIDGKRVAYLGEKCFANNTSITKIIFKGENSGDERLFLPSYTYIFYNLPNLTSVEFPYETRNYMQSNNYSGPTTILFNTTFYYIFRNCPKLTSVTFDSRPGGDHKADCVYFSIDGVVVMEPYNSINGRVNLIYYPEGRTNAEYTVPDNVQKIDEYAFHKNPHIKTIILGKEFFNISFPCFLNCTNFSEFKVSSKNKNELKAIDGVLYFRPYRTYTLNNETYTFGEICYPSGKKDKYFEFPKDVNIEISSHTLCGNPYIETFKFNGALRLSSATVYNDAFSRPTALKKFILNSKYGEGQITAKSKNWEIEYY